MNPICYSGIRRIRDLCQEHGVAEPLIEVSDSWVTTVFRRPVEQVGTKSAPGCHSSELPVGKDNLGSHEGPWPK